MKNPIIELFDSIIEDEVEREIMKLIVKEKHPDEIIKKLLSNKDKGQKK